MPFATASTRTLALIAVVMGPLFAIASQLKPLYADNQHTKFLHALASSGYGYLSEDWLSHTRDGLPLFTALVKLIYVTVGPAGFYIAGLATYALFCFCALVVYRRVTAPYNLPPVGVALFAAILLVLATITDVQELVFRGFAEQYVVGRYFQTADFGVFLICAVLLFETRSLLAAIPCIILAAAMHPAYVMPGASLITAFALYELLYEKAGGWRDRLVQLGACAFGIAALVGLALLVKWTFPVTDPQAEQQAHHILTAIRIPRHSDPAVWFTMTEILQCALCLAASLLLAPGRLRFVIRLGIAAVLLFTLGGMLPNMETYRLVAPWRLSVVIVPLASMGLCALLVARLLRPDAALGAMNAGVLVRNCIAISLLCAAIGGGFSLEKVLKGEPAYAPYVRANLAPGQLYLTPSGRQEFRLLTGAPQYVSFKSHPYQDVEVLEWHRRVREADKLYRGTQMDCALLQRFAEQSGVTHVVVIDGVAAPTSCGFAKPVFDSGPVKIFALSVARAAG